MGIFTWIWISICILPSSGSHIYNNQWGVFIEGGHESADQVAKEHGFTNHGQIGALNDHYVFSHKSVSEKSEELAHHHHQKLATHPKVLWAEQQKTKKRVKRDLLKRDIGELSNEASSSKTKPWDPHFKDPLWDKQWYLHDGGHAGYDMNERGAWKRGYTGRGVVITILDDGIERTHSDLKENYDAAASLDINGGDDDPMPRYDSTDENRHGTRCAGEVSAKANNTICGVGVAYNARIGGVRMLDGDVNDIVEAKALSHNPQHVDIYSASWGPDDDGKVVDGPATLAKKAFIQGVLQGRQGKGSIFVWASGNGGSSHDSCSCDGYTNSIFTLSVSSTSEHGTKPWYLEQCASTLTTTYSSGENYHERKVVTTDLRDRCTELHTGTSASAPLAAGLVALALEANPDLTWRDMQHIIVHTSRPEPMVDGDWVMNGVGRKVSHKYGYGLMDAEAMVLLAERWTNVPDQNLCISDIMKVDQPIEGTGSYVKVVTDGCTDTSNHVKYVEHVQAKVTLSVARRGDLQIHLTSPNGTRSTLLPQRKHDYSAFGFEEWPFMSVFYWGENPTGTWKLELENLGGAANVGVLSAWQLILYGTSTQPVKIRDAPAPGSGDIDPEEEDNIVVGGGGGGGQKHTEEESGGSGNKVEVSPPVGVECSSLCAEEAGCTGPLPSDCNACANVRLGDTGPCMEKCPAHTFPATGGICRHCLLSCDACTDTVTCTGCVDGYFLSPDHTCAATCKHGFAPDVEKGVCTPCKPPCAACSGGPSQCLSCLDGYTLSGIQCLAQCTSDQFRDELGRCMPCSQQCLTCLGADQCISCPDDMLYLNATCVEQCPPAFYASNATCTRCHPSCAECTGAGAGDCVSCPPPLKLSHSRCMEECPAGSYYSESGVCMPCHQSCATCRGPQPTQCVTCPTPTYHSAVDNSCVFECEAGTYASMDNDDADNTVSSSSSIYDDNTADNSADLIIPADTASSTHGRCLACHRDCSTCEGGGEHQHCTACAAHLVMSPTAGCVAECPTGEYMSGSSSSCVVCPGSCSVCSSDSVCSACVQGALLHQHSCLSHCPRGWYAQHGDQEHTDHCVPCHVACAHCAAPGPHACTECREGFSLEEVSGETGTCIEDAAPFQANCPDGQVFITHEQQCAPCHASCVRCFSTGPLGCETCQAGLQLYQERHQCVHCCGHTVTHTCCICNDTGVCQQNHFIIADVSSTRTSTPEVIAPTPNTSPNTEATEATEKTITIHIAPATSTERTIPIIVSTDHTAFDIDKEQSTPSLSASPIPHSSLLTSGVVFTLIACGLLALGTFIAIIALVRARQHNSRQNSSGGLCWKMRYKPVPTQNNLGGGGGGGGQVVAVGIGIGTAGGMGSCTNGSCNAGKIAHHYLHNDSCRDDLNHSMDEEEEEECP